MVNGVSRITFVSDTPLGWVMDQDLPLQPRSKTFRFCRSETPSAAALTLLSGLDRPRPTRGIFQALLALYLDKITNLLQPAVAKANVLLRRLEKDQV